MLKVPEAAERLGLSARKVYDLAASGRLASYRFDGSVRIDPIDVEAYKTSCRSHTQRVTVAGTSNLTASLREPGNALTAFFRKAGVGNKRTNTTATSAQESSPLRLV